MGSVCLSVSLSLCSNSRTDRRGRPARHPDNSRLLLRLKPWRQAGEEGREEDERDCLGKKGRHFFLAGTEGTNDEGKRQWEGKKKGGGEPTLVTVVYYESVHFSKLWVDNQNFKQIIGHSSKKDSILRKTTRGSYLLSMNNHFSTENCKY